MEIGNVKRRNLEMRNGNNALSFYMLLFHSLFKVKFNIDHFALGEHRKR